MITIRAFAILGPGQFSDQRLAALAGSIAEAEAESPEAGQVRFLRA
jgi:hypothetical protein